MGGAGAVAEREGAVLSPSVTRFSFYHRDTPVARASMPEIRRLFAVVVDDDHPATAFRAPDQARGFASPFFFSADSVTKSGKSSSAKNSSGVKNLVADGDGETFVRVRVIALDAPRRPRRRNTRVSRARRTRSGSSRMRPHAARRLAIVLGSFSPFSRRAQRLHRKPANLLGESVQPSAHHVRALDPPSR